MNKSKKQEHSANFWQGKKIITYIALLHHTRFIIPIMDKLTDLGARVQYVVGQAERSQEITAVECNLDYTHVFDYLSDDDFEDIQNNYLRERTVFSDSLAKSFILGTSILTVMDKTLYSSAQEYIGFRNMLSKEKPDLCFALHEVNRWGKMFAFWAKKFNIPFITLQEGLGYDDNYDYIGQVQYSTLDLVWGERFRNKLSDFEAPIERIIPVGNTHISNEIKLQEKNNIRNKIRKKLDLKKYYVSLLLFSGIPPKKDKILPLIEEVSNQSHLKLIIKFHPATTYINFEEWKASIPAELTKKVVFVYTEESTYDLISGSDLCVLARPSTTGIEAIAFGKPLIQLDLSAAKKESYSFVNQNVALEMTPSQLARSLAEKKDFSQAFDDKDIQLFFKNELTQTSGVRERIIPILKRAILANGEKKASPIRSNGLSKNFKWSFVIPVPPESPNEFLYQLSLVAENSDGQGKYEVILLEPEKLSPELTDILDSLEGDVTRITIKNQENIYHTVNTAVCPILKGEYSVFFSELACPKPGWIDALSTGIKKHGAKKIYGGKVINKFNNIIHAGVVLNGNNAPVSAYLHLDSKFPHANKERPFQLLDHLLALSTDFFCDLGGFSPEAGANSFMDICLKANNHSGDVPSCIFLPDLEILKETPKIIHNHDDSIYFYAKWHGLLWDNEDNLYNKDNVSKLQLEAARMTRAMEISNLKSVRDNLKK